MTDRFERVLPAAASPVSRRPAAPGRRWQLVLIVLLLVAISGELSGRAYGLHRPMLYEVTDYGYRVAPGQDFRRFDNRIKVNAQGLRNEALTPLPATGVTRILCLGDSVTNGGAITDQADTIPYRLEALLRPRLGAVEVLNASAPGWAIANERGWLSAMGSFGSRVVVLIISTHDLFQPLAPSSTVDSHPSFPASPPLLALQEVFGRYVLPRLFPGTKLAEPVADPGAAGVEISDPQAQRNRDDIVSIARLVEEQQGRLMVVFLEQASDNDKDARTLAAKQALFALLDSRGIPAVTLRKELATYGRAALYRDDVHPNPLGNQVIADAMARGLATMLVAP
jgi:lysophospholipase L1-like esterase